jgi:hypothetical protein
MLKYKMVIFMFLATFLTGGALAQVLTPNQRALTAFGKVVSIDVESGVLDVQTDHGLMEFYISAESILLKSTHAMSSLDMEKNDLVQIQYVITDGRNDVVKLDDAGHQIKGGGEEL